MNLIWDAVNLDDGVNDVAHATHGPKNHGVVAGGVVCLVGRQRSAADAAVGQAQAEKATGFFGLREGRDFGFLERFDEKVKGGAAS